MMDENMGSNQPNPEYIEQQRNKLWGCFFLTKHKLYAITGEMQEVMGKYKDESTKLYKKIVGDVFEKCIMNVQPEEGAKILESMSSREFKVEDWDYLHEFKLQKYEDPSKVELKLSADQEVFLNYFDEMDKQIKEKYGNEQQPEDDEAVFTRGKADFEPKIGGFSLKEVSTSTKALYAVIILGTIGGIFYLAYNKLFQTVESPYEKQKRAKKEKKEKKAAKAD